MLDLTALEARFRNHSSFGCKAAGGKVPFILPRGVAGWEKTRVAAPRLEEPEGQGLVGEIVDC
jgi:hypothetical protein